jgi:hypothetical protein
MKYQEDRKMEILQDEKYKGYRYIILSLGTHPTAYIEIPKGHNLYGQDYDDIDINVHGGLTYARHQLMGIDGENWYIGWDYAHAGDYYGGNIITRSTDKKWTTEEIEDECKEAINQIIDKYCQEKDIDIPLIPDDELYELDNDNRGCNERLAVDFNFKVLKEKINQVIEEFNEFRKEDK